MRGASGVALGACLLASAMAGPAVSAEPAGYPRTPFSMEHCLERLQAAMPSQVLSLEREDKQGLPYYEFEIRTPDKLLWEAECNANTGEIERIERDVKPDDFAFTSVARVSLADALRTALEEVPGTLRGVEYEVSHDGRAWYELTIRRHDGREAEVMVDAVTGALISTDDEEGSRTYYRIGTERE